MAEDGNRDRKGRFVPGNKAGKGRPRSEYASAFTQVITLDMWDKLIKRAYADGISGDQPARAWLADRILGKVPTVLTLRADELMLLEELLALLEAKGMSVSATFNELLRTFAEEEASHAT